jgi:hypothetical protein
MASLPLMLDFAFVNGLVFTGSTERSRRDVGVTGDRIVTVAERGALTGIGPATEVVDLGGRLLTPGFIDAHVHPVTGGLKLNKCSLFDLEGVEAALTAVAAYAASHLDEPWIWGGGWALNWFPNGTPPAELLDRVVSDRPVLLHNKDGHGAWVNTKALELAGIDRSTPDPPDGRIERLPDGSAQGTLHEGAVDLAERLYPPPDAMTWLQALLTGQRFLHSFGITGWQDADVRSHDRRAYMDAVAAGLLTARVVGAQWWERDRGREQIDEFEHNRRTTVGNFRQTSVKLMLDGIAENYTASMLDPYMDADGAGTANRGIDFIDPNDLPGIVTELDSRGFQCHFHAIGDRAVRSALDAVEAARAVNGVNDLRHHIAHLQVVDRGDHPRFAGLGVTANAQPLWAQHEPQMDELTLPFLGPERGGRQYPFASLVRAGAGLAMGSDWSVSTPDVMAQAQIAVHRREADGPEPFLPDECLTLDQVLAAFTAGSAYVNHIDNEVGSIRPGMLADIAILSADPFELEDLAEVEVDLTMVGGQVVHRR